MRKIAAILLTSVFVILQCAPIFSTATAVDLDQFLRDAGVPENVIATLAEDQKQLIYETSIGEEISFFGFESKDYFEDQDGNLVEICSEQSSPRSVIPASHLTLSVLGMETYAPTTGTYSYKIYPTFQWHVRVTVKNDSFSMAMYPGWEVVPGDRSMRLHITDDAGTTSMHSVTIESPANATSAGYSFMIDSNIGTGPAIYRGAAYFRAKKTSTSASPNISLHYFHDTTPLFQASYGISIGFSQISVNLYSGTGDQVGDNFVISGLE